jgi:hypothetical protein
MPREGKCIVESGKIAISGTICWAGERGIRLDGRQIYAVDTYQTLPDGREGIKRWQMGNGEMNAQGCTERWAGVM